MLCDRVFGRVADPPPAGAIPLPLTWQECRSRAVSKALPGGRVIRILLPPGVVLRHGDVIHDSPAVFVDLLPAAVLSADVSSPRQLLRAVYALGNLHLPMEITGDTISTLDDGPARSVFREIGVSSISQTRRFDPLPLPNGLAFRLGEGFTIERRP